jgi:hypothetical protein
MGDANTEREKRFRDDGRLAQDSVLRSVLQGESVPSARVRLQSELQQEAQQLGLLPQHAERLINRTLRRFDEALAESLDQSVEPIPGETL